MIRELLLSKNLFICKENNSYLYDRFLLFFNNLKSIFFLKRKNIEKKKKENKNKKDDDNLKKGKNRYQILFELAPDGIMTINTLGFITSANTAYYNLTGYAEEEILGKHMFKVNAMQKEYLPKYLKLFTRFIKGEKPEPFEFTYIHKDGSIRWADARFTLMNTENVGIEIIVILREITEKKEQDERLLKTINDLDKINRELDDYTYAVSHDLKAPLRTIGSFANFLLEDYSEDIDEVGREYMLRMQSASLRMTELIDDLLLISRVGRMDSNIELLDMNTIVNDIIDDNKSLLEAKNGKIIAGELPIIKIQRIWMKQLFTNLVSNGLKFNESSNPTVWIECEEKEDHYLFSVKDNGIGIEKKYHEKIFKIFQRLHTSEEYQGTGAGLTICKKIVESMGGSIRLESKVDKGTVFYLIIPKEKIRPEDSESLVHVEDDQMIV